MYRLSFLSSGTGSLTATIIHAIKKGILKNITPVSIISDRESKSLQLTSLFGGTSHIVDFNASHSREEFSNKVLEIFQNEKIDFSFMTFDRILSGNIINEYRNRIINIHPSLLPAFPGYNNLAKAKEYGCKFIGATCHFIDAEIDNGPIINQAILPLNSLEESAKIEEKLYRLRQKLALEAIYAFSNGLIEVNKRNVLVKNAKYDEYPPTPCLNIPSINDFINNYDK